MANFRQNHGKGKGRAASGETFLRVGLLAALIAGALYLFFDYSGGTLWHPAEKPLDYAGEDYFLPAGSSGQVIHHAGYTLSYSDEWEQAEWVAYILEGDALRQPWTERDDKFVPDTKVRGRSAEDFDYRGSGYDRGHLAPFADFAWNADLARETFYLSNISPQVPEFNRGIWRELEELTRDWAKDFGRLYVISGPVTTLAATATIGRDTRVAVPRSYFKVLLDLDSDQPKAIGFILPNKVSFEPLEHYAMSVDEVEAIIDLDLFAELMPQKEESRIEAAVDPGRWPFDEDKFTTRIKNWNHVDY